jgi:hypothetical protein
VLGDGTEAKALRCLSDSYSSAPQRAKVTNLLVGGEALVPASRRSADSPNDFGVEPADFKVFACRRLWLMYPRNTWALTFPA